MPRLCALQGAAGARGLVGAPGLWGYAGHEGARGVAGAKGEPGRQVTPLCHGEGDRQGTSLQGDSPRHSSGTRGPWGGQPQSRPQGKAAGFVLALLPSPK